LTEETNSLIISRPSTFILFLQCLYLFYFIYFSILALPSSHFTYYLSSYL
jgi:hypothetical protein